LQFESWTAASPVEVSSKLTVGRLVPGSRNRTRQALLGGAIGAAAGVVICTAFSTLVNDSAEGGLSFCPLDTYLLFGGAGFVLGAVIGWAI
jgi:ABC-type branched-subunit amino acid transport system permease subunit